MEAYVVNTSDRQRTRLVLACRQPVNSPTANNHTEEHPLHLHGHHFWLLATGNDTYDSSSAWEYNLANPVYRDTYILPQYGWAVIRFVVSD